MMEDPEIGLCFELPGSDHERYLIPEALPASEPDYGIWPKDALRFRFSYDLLPPGLIPRFIVQAHRNLTDKPTRWRTGVVLGAAGCRVLVRGDRDRRRIDISVAGPAGLRRSALNIVLDDLDEVHARNPGDRRESAGTAYRPTRARRQLRTLAEAGGTLRPRPQLRPRRRRPLLHGRRAPRRRPPRSGPGVYDRDDEPERRQRRQPDERRGAGAWTRRALMDRPSRRRRFFSIACGLGAILLRDPDLAAALDRVASGRRGPDRRWAVGDRIHAQDEPDLLLPPHFELRDSGGAAAERRWLHRGCDRAGRLVSLERRGQRLVLCGLGGGRRAASSSPI